MALADRTDNERPIGFSDDPMLLLHYTARCNASCAHCIVESGPQRAERMTVDHAAELIDGAGDVPRLRTVVFSGGESFIYLDDVLALCARARARGLVTRVISNGYWARSADAAATMLERLAECHVDQLVISFSEFHRAYVPAARVRNVFLGACQAERAPLVAYSTVCPGLADDPLVDDGEYAWPSGVLRELASYGFAPEECVPLHAAVRRAAGLAGHERTRFKRAMVHERALINWEPLVMGGRASRALADRLRPRVVADEAGPCAIVGRQITVVTSGRVYPCCSTWSNFSEHAFGTVRMSSDVAVVVDEMQRDPLIRFIQERGPGPLIAWLRRAGRPLMSEYADICHMCQTLFENLSLDELREAARSALGDSEW